MAPILGQVSVVAKDMEKAIAFYERLGLTFEKDPQWAAHHVSARMPNGVALDLDSEAMTTGYDPGWSGTVAVIFNVDDPAEVDRLHDELVAGGATSHQAPFDAFWGARYAVVDDPDGNHVGIMAIDPSRGGPPPQL